MKTRKPIQRISAKQRKRLQDYAKIKKVWMRADPTGRHSINRKCMWPACENIATDVHHSRGRCSTLLCDVRYWKSLCRSHHTIAHDNPVIARYYGITCEPGLWNKPEVLETK